MNVRRVAAAVLVGSLIPLSAAVTTAHASTAVESHTVKITAVPSDTTPASGQEFRVRGAFTVDGQPAVDRPVKVQTWRNDAWEQLKGAKVNTNDEGRYQVRVILQQKGERLLRVVGVSPEGIRNAYHRFTVTVH